MWAQTTVSFILTLINISDLQSHLSAEDVKAINLHYRLRVSSPCRYSHNIRANASNHLLISTAHPWCPSSEPQTDCFFLFLWHRYSVILTKIILEFGRWGRALLSEWHSPLIHRDSWVPSPTRPGPSASVGCFAFSCKLSIPALPVININSCVGFSSLNRSTTAHPVFVNITCHSPEKESGVHVFLIMSI